MSRVTRVLFLLPAIFLLIPTISAEWIHSPMPGVNPNRDSFYSDLYGFGPPFDLASTDQLPGGAVYIFPMHSGILATRSGGYTMYSPSGRYSGEAGIMWTRTAFAGASEPAYSREVVFLSSATTASIDAVNVIDGTTLWTGPGVGEYVYSAVAAGDTVFFDGSQRVVAARLEDGSKLWEYTPDAELSGTRLVLADGLLFVMDRVGTVHALSTATGEDLWKSPNAGDEYSTLMAAPGYVYVASFGKIVALETKQGSRQWDRQVPSFAPRMAYANGRLFATYPPQGWALGTPPPEGLYHPVIALDGRSGSLLWELKEEVSYPSYYPGPPSSYWLRIRSLFVADGRVFFFNDSKSHVRALDAATGKLEWSMEVPGYVNTMTVRERQLLLFRNTSETTSVEFYAPRNELYMAEFAYGQGYSVELTVNNPGDQELGAVVTLYSASGEEVKIPDSQGGSLSAYLSIPAYSSKTLALPDDGQPVRTGWAVIRSPLPCTASLVYRYAPPGGTFNEVGVGASLPTDFANVKVTHGAGFSTAVALAVPGNEDAHVYVQLLDGDGKELVHNDLVLGSHKQIAKFFNELLYQDLSFSTFDGTIIIRSNQPIVVTALRTRDGTPVSSFPVGVKN